MFRGLLLLFTLLTAPAAAQVYDIAHAYGPGPVSRGAIALVRGANLATATATAQDWVNLPTELGGASVTIDGLPCRLMMVGPTAIMLVVPDEVPQSQYVKLRFGWYISPQVLRVKAKMSFEYKFHLTDTAPWWNVVNGYPLGLVVGAGGMVQVVERGVIPVIAGSTVRLHASGARSFRSPENVFYKVLLYTEAGELLEVEARIEKDPVLPGIDLVLFSPPAEWAGLKGWIYLQTPSNFSEGVAAGFK